MHNLEIVNGKASMVYNKQWGNPWHELGTAVEGAMTALEALQLSKQDWEAVKIQLEYQGKPVSAWGIMRSDNGIVLGTCGEDYQPIQNTEQFNCIAFCSRACKEKAQSLASKAQSFAICPPHYIDGSSVYRKIAFKYHPKKCNRCGYDKIIGILRVHHRDRNRKNTLPDNLEVLCPNCHAEEHFLAKDGLYHNLAK